MTFAFVFPGQGSQSVGMMQSFSDSGPVRGVFSEASDTLGQDLWKLAAEGPPEALSATVNTQPLMLTAGYAIYRAWLDAGGGEPSVVAGHSLGEYTALVVAGALAFRDALPLVRFRAQAMQEAVPMGQGAMAAILGLEDDAVRAACSEAAHGQVVEPVNFNAPRQVVIAGHKAAVERGVAVATSKGAKRAMMLPVSAPFHSSLLKPAAEKLSSYLGGVAVSAPRIRVVNNVDVAVETDPQRIRQALARQACSPVRWVETVRRIAADGIAHIAECGPGKVLAGLTRRIDGALQSHAIADAPALQQALVAFKT
ncbi:MAG TPA: ACP S-malonyltransferase [Burkholderiales bacterium]|nr:ACP S-malonyltransferase [Burkholderiales bacterium]